MWLSFSTLLFLVSCLYPYVTEGEVIDLTTSGAKADGTSDIAEVLTTVWTTACGATTPSVILIPAGTYMLGQVSLKGPCKNPITLQVEGTVKAPEDPTLIKGDVWVNFDTVDLLKIMGKGTFDGQGSVAWTKNDCTKNVKCVMLPSNLRFNFVTNALVQDITTLNSKGFHVMVFGSKNITFQGIKIIAPEDSPNTDGIHVGHSSAVTIADTSIETGDDCVSIGDGSEQVTITSVTCGPGHGISIGSLGKYKNELPVNGIFVNKCTLTNTMTGVRIKSWPASLPGVATDMHFEDITMNNVSDPVLIDQGYCPWNQCTAGVPSNVKISKVSYKNIKGTIFTPVAVKLICSKAFPCEGVELADINLTYQGTNGTATSICENVTPKVSGTQNPPICGGAPAPGAAASS